MENDRTIMCCPVCGSSLWFGDGAECANGHHYDRAKEGYVNLLTGHRPGQAQGDSREFSRILKPEGILLSVIPGRGHLMGLKKVLYATPYENDEKPPKAEHFTLLKTERVRAEAHITGQENIGALLRMTPYFYHTPSDGLNRLEALSTLDTELDFVLLYYQKLK